MSNEPFLPLLYIKMFSFNIGIRELKEYQKFMENSIELEKGRVEKGRVEKSFKDIEKEFKDKDSDYYDYLIDSASENFQQFDTFFPNSLRESMIVRSFSFLEFNMKRLCDKLYKERNLVFKMKDLKGNSDLECSQTYLKKTCNIVFGDFNPEWEFIDKVRVLRNFIVHSNGEFNLNNHKVAKFVTENNSLSVENKLYEFQHENQTLDYKQ